MKAIINALVSVNGFDIALVSEPIKSELSIATRNGETKEIVDKQSFKISDPADVAAAFEKFSQSITWAVQTSDVDSKTV